MKRIAALMLAGVLMFGAIGCSKNDSGSTTTENGQTQDEVMVQDMKGQELVDFMADEDKSLDALLIDVRSADEYADGHIQGAVNIPHDEMESRVGEIEGYKEHPVILYCNTGNRSGQAAKVLVDNGFKVVYNAEGVKEFEYELVQ
ncbi:MAG: rhodanese-like domain-containing protein [Peptostreptococcaceae bacterium]|nr:rhodanese-like domain-containing protein [Peptostreptococcaceae bacterium]